MATGQPTRFSAYGKSSTRDNATASQPLVNFPSANWNQSNPSNPWAFGPREAQPHLQGHEGAYSSSPDGPATSSNVWAANPWNNAENTSRKASASPSPVRSQTGQPRKDLLHDVHVSTNSGASYLANRVVTNGNYRGPRQLTAGSLDSTAATYRYSAGLPSLRDSIADVGDKMNFKFDPETSALKGLNNGFSASGAATSLPPSASASTSSAASAHSATHPNIGRNFLPSHNGHAHRSSLHGPIAYPSPAPSAPSATQGAYQRQPQAEDTANFTLSDMLLHQKLNTDDRNGPTTAIFENGLAIDYANAGPNFQFNPDSQPWGGDQLASAGVASSLGFMAGLDRGVAHHANTFRSVNSTAGFGLSGIGGQWSRPSSRDTRNAAFPDVGLQSNAFLSRSAAQTLIYEQQQQQAAAVAAVTAFAGAPNFFPPINPYYQLRAPPIQSPQLGLTMTPSFLPTTHLQQHQIPRDRGDPTQPYRSKLLDEYRTSRSNRKYELKDIYDHIVEFSGDQHGSRFIQSKLETANSDEKEHVFREISTNTAVLMQDVFGNYVVQKFFEHGNQVQKKYLAEQMRGKMVDLSMQTYACRVVQKALQHILVEQQVALAKELESDVIRVIKDANGNHVIQKVIELVPREHIGFIMDAFRGRVRELSAHNYGCRVIQRMLEHGRPEDKSLILSELHDNVVDLINDQYGNYVAQHVIQFGEPDDREKIVSKVLDQLVTMSNNKYASNVVEKCIEFGTEADRSRILEELNRPGPDGQPALQLMIRDQFGNYVIQKLLKQLKGEESKAFVDSLSTQLATLKRSTTGRQNAAIDRLATAVDELAKGNGTGPSSPGKKADGGPVSPSSPHFQADRDSTPSLASIPTTPESSNPPSVSAGSSGGSSDTEAKSGSTVKAKSIDTALDGYAETPAIPIP